MMTMCAMVMVIMMITVVVMVIMVLTILLRDKDELGIIDLVTHATGLSLC